MRYSFVVPSYKKPELMIECLRSIRKFYPDDEIIVSDDGSPRDIQLEIRGICKVFGAKLLTAFWNNGFGHTTNRGLENAQGDIIVLVNNDVIFTKDIKPETDRIFDMDEKIGIVGYLLYYPNGKIQHAGYQLVTEGIFFDHYEHGLEPRFAKKAFQTRYEIGVTAALISIRKTMLNEIGGFKSGYKLAFEDCEFCLRTWHTGWRIYYTGEVSAIHCEGATRGATPEEKKAVDSFEAEQISNTQYRIDVRTYDIPAMFEKIKGLNGGRTFPAVKTVGLQRMRALGDVVMSTGIINALSEVYPNAKIHVCTLKDNEYPFLNNSKVAKIYNDPFMFRKQTEIVFDLDMVSEQDPQRPIWEAYAEHCFKSNWTQYDVLPKLYNSQVDRLELLIKLKKLNPQLGKNFVVIHPAKTWASRDLGVDKWNELIEKIIKKGHKVVVLGTEVDHKVKQRTGVYDLRGAFTLGEVRQLIKASKCFIGMDSSLMHIAQTTNTPVIGIFSVSDPANLIHRRSKTKAIIPKTECKYCKTREKGLIKAVCKKGTNECIKSITALDIMKVVREFIR